MKITKRVEFDAGHRIPSHASKCRNLHGHRYVVELEVDGPVNPIRNETDDGMVMDFGDLKAAAMRYIHDVFDHKFIVYNGDALVRNMLCKLDDVEQLEFVSVPFVPTAENLCVFFAAILDLVFSGKEYYLTRLTVWETPTSTATWERPSAFPPALYNAAADIVKAS